MIQENIERKKKNFKLDIEEVVFVIVFYVNLNQ